MPKYDFFVVDKCKNNQLLKKVNETHFYTNIVHPSIVALISPSAPLGALRSKRSMVGGGRIGPWRRVGRLGASLHRCQGAPPVVGAAAARRSDSPACGLSVHSFEGMQLNC